MNQESGSINIYGELSEPMTISHSNVIIKGGVIAKIIIAITMLCYDKAIIALTWG